MDADTDIGQSIWEARYRHRIGGVPQETSIQDSWRRLARAISSSEVEAETWAKRYLGILQDFRFLPGGRILAGAGTRHRMTLLNCFVMGVIEDSMAGIFDALREGALTMQQGGGIGYDFSTLRPRGSSARTTNRIASGPVSFMHVWDSMCNTVLAYGSRRGAMMATLRADHPDIEEFINAKRDPSALRRFNLSVQVSDAFLAAVRDDAVWTLAYPDKDARPGVQDERASESAIDQIWTGTSTPVRCQTYRVLRARDLWQVLMQATYDCGEPGVLFVDQINRQNNLWYAETLTATNPCGETPLPPYGACDLGSINLTRFVRRSFTRRAHFDLDQLATTAATATRMLDAVLDITPFPLPAQEETAKKSRRIGIGITGLADALIMLGLHYADESARRAAATAMRTICHSAYRASIELAREKGAFPLYVRERFLAGHFVAKLPPDIRDGIAQSGIRNSHVIAIAPAGSISLLAGNVSSGIEPLFDLRYRRNVVGRDGLPASRELSSLAYRQWLSRQPSDHLPRAFVRAQDLPPSSQLAMQAELQQFVDGAIAKTVHIPADLPFEDFAQIYSEAAALGLKGCTTFRAGSRRGAVMIPLETDQSIRAPGEGPDVRAKRRHSAPKRTAAPTFDSH
jgi:ribonucleoside-diphosphate reductase alpha chain